MRHLLRFAACLLAAWGTGACGAHQPRDPSPSALETAALERFAIHELVQRFSDATNHGEWRELEEAFTDDASWEANIPIEFAHLGLGRGFRFEGRRAIRAGLESSTQHVAVLEQQVTPVAVKLESGTHASSRATLREVLRVNAANKTFTLVGTYTDTLVKERGRWLFARRSFRLRYAHELCGEYHPGG